MFLSPKSIELLKRIASFGKEGVKVAEMETFAGSKTEYERLIAPLAERQALEPCMDETIIDAYIGPGVVAASHHEYTGIRISCHGLTLLEEIKHETGERKRRNRAANVKWIIGTGLVVLGLALTHGKRVWDFLVRFFK